MIRGYNFVACQSESLLLADISVEVAESAMLLICDIPASSGGVGPACRVASGHETGSGFSPCVSTISRSAERQ